MTLIRRTCLSLPLLAWARPSRAATPAWPSRPVHLLVPYAPGGPTDILARLVAPVLAERLGQAVVVDNTPGAGGNIGMAQGAKAAPDGHTVTVVAPNIVINPALYRSAGYDPFADFTAVMVAVRAPIVLGVHPSLPATTLDELVALVKSQPGRHSYASPGIGTPPHLLGEQFRLSLGLDLVHVPYQSAGQAVAAALGAQVPIVFSTTPPALAHMAAGKLRGLAVTGSARMKELPTMPTMAEAGRGEVDGEGWFGFVVPAGTPKATVAALHRALSEAMDSAAVRARLPALGFEPVLSAPEASAAHFRSEGDKWGRLIRTAGIKAE